MMIIQLEFKQKSKVRGIEGGYYFKGEYLSRLKFLSLDILRKRIIDAGKGNFEKGKEILPDEWGVIHHEWEKGEERSKKTYENKKPYYERLHINALKHKILTLQNKMEMLNKRKEDIEKEFSDKILAVEKERKNVEDEIKVKENK